MIPCAYWNTHSDPLPPSDHKLMVNCRSISHCFRIFLKFIFCFGCSSNCSQQKPYQFEGDVKIVSLANIKAALVMTHSHTHTHTHTIHLMFNENMCVPCVLTFLVAFVNINQMKFPFNLPFARNVTREFGCRILKGFNVGFDQISINRWLKWHNKYQHIDISAHSLGTNFTRFEIRCCGSTNVF